MSLSSVTAITFDLWDTLLVDDSDEPKRAANGLLPKKDARRALVFEFLNRHEPVAKAQVDVAFDVVDAAFNNVWYQQNVTWQVKVRLAVLLNGLGRTLPKTEFGELTKLLEEMELEVQPDLAPGVAEVLNRLHGKYRLGVISDAIFSPGRVLKQLLESYDIAHFFDAFAFSDEVGCSKPTPLIFKDAAQKLNVDPSGIVHIGDREQKDVKGAHQVGAKAVFCTVVKDRGSASTQAEAICANYVDLPRILEDL